MSSSIRVALPPPKPLMIYDGDCHFCTLWIRRWQHATGDRVDYLPYQDPTVRERFPEIPLERFETAVQLIAPGGSVTRAAEAVFGAIAANPKCTWLLELHQSSPGFRQATECAYSLVARHRMLFSFLTRLVWGNNVGPFRYDLVRRLFLRSLGLVYLIAIVSLWLQIPGLAGSHGILPVASTMQEVRRAANAAKMGFERYHLLPTFCWISASDASLNFQCAAGTFLAALLILGIAPAPCLFLLWMIYLSLSNVCGVFLGFQWDALLLETGFLAIFLAPLQWLPRHPSREAPPSRIVLWLLRWLLFRLMFESGVVKLLSGDPAWRHLTALNFHYETQPLPTWIGWYAWHLPSWLHRGDVLVVFFTELFVPFLIFLPRRPRQLAFGFFIVFQIAIILTGNYGFFNLLTIVLCLTLLDDDLLTTCSSACARRIGKLKSANVARSETDNPSRFQRKSAKQLRWPIQIPLLLLALVLVSSLVQFGRMFRFHISGPEPVLGVYQWLQPFESLNTYGLFAVMTTNRPEIIIEGSNDGAEWKPYEFRYKPGAPDHRPRFVAPYQPRLDWQMWFAALSDVQHNPWLVNFCVRLLQGSPQVLNLLGRNPFPEKPPRYIRAVLYEYEFTSMAEHRKKGAWWKRRRLGLYLPPISLRENSSEKDPP